MRTILQIVHGYNAPFLDLAAQYGRLFRGRGHRVVTLFLTGKPDQGVAERAGADEILFWNVPSRKLRGLKLGLVGRLRRLCRERAVDLIVAQRYKPMYLGLLASTGLKGIPVVGVAHAFGVLDASARRRLLWLMGERWRMLGVSEAITADLRAAMPGRADRCATLHNCVDPTRLASAQLPRAAARHELDLDGEFVFGNVGRLHPDKDQATLIEAFAHARVEMPDATLVLIGEGRNERAYRELAERLGVSQHTRITGFVPDARRLFPAFDGYVSTSNREPFGMVLTEAMAASLPIISTDCGGAPEVLGDEGWYFKAGDVVGLARKMVELHRLAAEVREKQGSRLRERLVAEFSPAAFAEKALHAQVWPTWF